MSNYFEKDCIRYIESCENNGVTFQEDLKRSLIQGARATDSFSNPMYQATMKLRMLSMILEEAKNRGWLEAIINHNLESDE